MTTIAAQTLLRMPRSAPEKRVALFERGFRPFFAAASLFAAVAVPAWLLALHGGFQPGGPFGAMQWHAHEMLFGFTAAVVAGFVLTAAANWTARPTLRGAPLAALAAVWVLGRIAVFFAAWAPGVAAIVDCSFLPALTLACARPLFAARNRRNYVFVVLLTALTTLNAGAHFAAFYANFELVRALHRVALDVSLFVVVLVTGRIVPSFTRNATGAARIESKPSLERAALVAVAAVAASDVFAAVRPAAPTNPLVAFSIAAAAAALLAARMVRWGSFYARREPWDPLESTCRHASLSIL